MTDTFEDVARSKYLLLTTFTKDGYSAVQRPGQAERRTSRGGGPESAQVRQSTGLRHGHQQVLVARVVVDSAGDRARRHRQGPQRRRAHARLTRRKVGVLGGRPTAIIRDPYGGAPSDFRLAYQAIHRSLTSALGWFPTLNAVRADAERSMDGTEC